MPTGLGIISDTFNLITTAIHDSIGESVIALSTPLSIVFIAALYLYMVYVAYTWFTSHQTDVLMEGIKHLTLFAVITTIAFNSNYYINNIVPIVLNLGSELGGLITKTGGTESSLDKFITTIYFAIKKIYATSDGFKNTLIAIINIGLILISSVVFVATAFGILLTAKIMVALLLSVGTIFIAFAMFPTTRTWFQQWIGLCWNYILITLLFPIALAVEIKVIDRFVFSNGVLTTDLSTIVKLLLVLLAFNAISVQIPVLASSLSGGVGINGMASSFSAAMRPLVALKRLFSRGGKGNQSNNPNQKSRLQRLRERFGNNIKAG